MHVTVHMYGTLKFLLFHKCKEKVILCTVWSVLLTTQQKRTVALYKSKFLEMVL